MCHFITAVIDKKTNLDQLNQLGQDYGIAFNICDNDYVKDQLRPTEQYVAKKVKYCDCGTSLGMLARAQSPDGLRVEIQELERLRRKGWSESKIQRWVADREKSIEKARSQFDSLANGKPSSADGWLRYFHGIFSDGSIRHMGLLLHWYRRGPETERIKIKKREVIRMGDLSSQILLSIDEDVIYDITR